MSRGTAGSPATIATTLTESTTITDTSLFSLVQPQTIHAVLSDFANIPEQLSSALTSFATSSATTSLVGAPEFSISGAGALFLAALLFLVVTLFANRRYRPKS